MLRYFLVALLGAGCAHASTIQNSVALISRFPGASGSSNGQACLYLVGSSTPTCLEGSPITNSTVSGPASATASNAQGPARAQGSVELREPVGSIGEASSLVASGTVTSAFNLLSFIGAIDISLLPDAPIQGVGQSGQIQAGMGQVVQQLNPNGAGVLQGSDLRLSVNIRDSGAVLDTQRFVLDPNAATMVLTVGPASSGSIRLYSTSSRAGTPAVSTPLIDYVFANGVVTSSRGLNLPAAGQPASFEVTVLPDDFSFTIPGYDPANGSISLFSYVQQSGTLTALSPEPGTFALAALALLAAGLFRRGRSARSRTSPNTPSPYPPR